MEDVLPSTLKFVLQAACPNGVLALEYYQIRIRCDIWEYSNMETAAGSNSAKTKVERQRRLVAQVKRVTGLEPTTIANRAGISPSTFSRINKQDTDNAFSPRTLAKLQEFVSRPEYGYTIDMDAMTLLAPDGREVEVDSGEIVQPTARRSHSDNDPRAPQQQSTVQPVSGIPRGLLPVEGHAMDGYVSTDGSPDLMWLNPAMAGSHDYVDCPPWLSGVSGAYAVRVLGRALEPVLLVGDVAHIAPIELEERATALRPGDVIVLQDKPSTDGSMPVPHVGILRSNTGNTISFGTLSGASQSLNADNIEYVHRVVSVRRL